MTPFLNTGYGMPSYFQSPAMQSHPFWGQAPLGYNVPQQAPQQQASGIRAPTPPATPQTGKAPIAPVLSQNMPIPQRPPVMNFGGASASGPMMPGMQNLYNLMTAKPQQQAMPQYPAYQQNMPRPQPTYRTGQLPFQQGPQSQTISIPRNQFYGGSGGGMDLGGAGGFDPGGTRTRPPVTPYQVPMTPPGYSAGGQGVGGPIGHFGPGSSGNPYRQPVAAPVRRMY